MYRFMITVIKVVYTRVYKVNNKSDTFESISEIHMYDFHDKLLKYTGVSWLISTSR